MQLLFQFNLRLSTEYTRRSFASCVNVFSRWIIPKRIRAFVEFLEDVNYFRRKLHHMRDKVFENGPNKSF